jgi:GNAT superfamily N-acetyltransferase
VSALTREEVADAATGWLWYPPDAVVVTTPDYLLVRFPDHFGEPLQVLRTDPAARIGSELVEEVLARARDLQGAQRRAHVTWWVKLDAPTGLEDLLRERGPRDETLSVLARPLDGGLPDLAVPGDVELRVVDDRVSARHSFEVEAAVFGGSVPDEGRLDAAVADCRSERASGAGERYVAYLGGEPVGGAGLSLVEGVARLWGAGVLAAHRHRGVYRALLEARLRWGADRGARMALVKGRVESSAPVLTRAGFTTYGEERSYRVPLR